MSTATLAHAYCADDLHWLREALGGPVELDPWGNAVVSPASDPHHLATSRLVRLLVLALQETDAAVTSSGPPWRVPGGSGYTNQPDVTVLPGRDIGRDPDHEWHLSPPPLLVVEVASPSTRTIDRTRKRDDYLLGGAEQYLLVDLPGLAPVETPTLELWTPAGEAWTTIASGVAIGLDLAGRRLELHAASLTPASE